MSSALNIASARGLKGHGVFCCSLDLVFFSSLSRIVSLLLYSPASRGVPAFLRLAAELRGTGLGNSGTAWKAAGGDAESSSLTKPHASTPVLPPGSPRSRWRLCLASCAGDLGFPLGGAEGGS